MFELEHELQEWTKRFSRMEVMCPGDIVELEQHVRDSVGNLTSKGLSEEEAFLIATHRVGGPGPVGREYGKVNGGYIWGRRLFWMLAGYLFIEACQLTITAVASLGQVLAASAGLDGTVMGYTTVGITALCWLGLAIWLHRWSVDRNDGHSIARMFMQSQGTIIVGGVVFIVVVATLVKFGSQITVARITSVQEYGQAAVISAWGNALFATLFPLLLLIVMLAIRRSLQDTVAGGQ